MNKIIYNIVGGASLSLGIIGAFLPLIPSTCFILLATWAYSKSSPTFHAWLYYKSPFAKSIQDWQQYRVIPTKVKWIAAVSIAVSYSITMLFIENVYVLFTVGISLLGLLAYLFSKPGQVQHVTYQPLPELHQPVNQIRLYER